MTAMTSDSKAPFDALIEKWQRQHSNALSQAKGETDDQTYTWWMRLAAVTRNHLIDLEELREKLERKP